MMFLFDTHTLLWATIRPEMLSERVAALIADERNVMVVSAASAWEIATKVRLGKLKEAVEFERNFLSKVREAGYQLLPVSVEDGLRAGRLVGNHGDPFDRMIAAQALTMDIAVLSNDAKLDSFGIQRIW